jgi:hypothetical protein
MFRISRRAAVPTAIFAIAASTSVGTAVATTSQASHPSSRAVNACRMSTKMNHALWRVLRQDVTKRYSHALRGGVWRTVTSHPALAHRLVNRWSHRRALAATCAGPGRSAHPAALLSASGSPIDPSGQSMPTGNIAGWHQVFADDFSQNVPLGRFPSAVQSRWGNSYPDGWKDTTGSGTYMPSKVVSIANGIMNMHVHTENGVHMVAAPAPTIPGAPGNEGGLHYGRYVVRFRADAVAGYKTAWLLWPDSESWPSDGEIDFPEGDLNGTIGGFVHHQGASSGSDQAAFDTNVRYTGWHTATITWLPSGVTFQLDGNTIGKETVGVPNTPMHLVLQTETSTDASGPSNSAGGNVQIDWISVYSPA